MPLSLKMSWKDFSELFSPSEYNQCFHRGQKMPGRFYSRKSMQAVKISEFCHQWKICSKGQSTYTTLTIIYQPVSPM